LTRDASAGVKYGVLMWSPSVVLSVRCSDVIHVLQVAYQNAEFVPQILVFFKARERLLLPRLTVLERMFFFASFVDFMPVDMEFFTLT
jgi:hypothetical protein